MTLDLGMYRTWLFDCDGVILDSNRLKTRAFHHAVLRYGAQAADALVHYHVLHGGISRFQKFQYFFESILGRPPGQHEMDECLAMFAAFVRTGLETCNISPGLAGLLTAISPGHNRLVVSGGHQEELRTIFRARGLADGFDAIFGSPDSKDEIIERELNTGRIQRPGIFLGDSQYDHHVACRFGFEFVFISRWSEFQDWPHYCQINNIAVVADLAELVPLMGRA